MVLKAGSWFFTSTVCSLLLKCSGGVRFQLITKCEKQEKEPSAFALRAFLRVEQVPAGKSASARPGVALLA